MSSKAITRRLRQTDELRELPLSLMKAKVESDVKKTVSRNEQTGANVSPVVSEKNLRV